MQLFRTEAANDGVGVVCLIIIVVRVGPAAELIGARVDDQLLHMADIELLLNVIHALVDEGNTVVVIEHNLSVIAEADYIVDLGPEAGANGGAVVACGTPEQVAKNRVSRTAPFLRKVLNASRAKKARSS